MDIKTLKLFLSLTKTLHFANTADEVNMSTSAVSRSVRRLEEEIGQALFYRDNRKVELTRAGMLYQQFAEEVVLKWRAMEQAFNHEALAPSGVLNLFCSVTASYAILSSLLPQVRQRYPGIEVHVHTGDQADAIARIQASKEQIGITVRPKKLPDNLVFLPLTTTPLKIIAPMSDKSLLEELRQVSADSDWSSLPFIVSETGEARARLDDWFAGQGRKANIYAQVSGHEAIVSLVSLGFGIGLVPDLVIQSSPMKDVVRVFTPEPEIEDFDVGLIVQKHRLIEPIIKSFWQCGELITIDQ
ncbi:Hydrogen peroxide-inducible genes activator [Sinobacterium norvegicum]|uniref:Hydrogen peroxide-inducible genes activator n=1 Tax=Sinobacterium norvegicum TaxID=1641715 RepID=A0ABN8ELD3_9GAMM|nr:HTH-type transcriptional activator IlvY [Sinobacterium norvegicum]CAH0993215.1 Hydrogen peroxide-inducible genes activator [Sinobacterium norvegicum]